MIPSASELAQVIVPDSMTPNGTEDRRTDERAHVDHAGRIMAVQHEPYQLKQLCISILQLSFSCSLVIPFSWSLVRQLSPKRGVLSKSTLLELAQSAK